MCFIAPPVKDLVKWKKGQWGIYHCPTAANPKLKCVDDDYCSVKKPKRWKRPNGMAIEMI